MEGVERNSNRKEYFRQVELRTDQHIRQSCKVVCRYQMRAEHRIEGIDEEKCVFEIWKYEKVYENAENQIGFTFPFLFRPMDCITNEIVQYNVNYQ